MSSLSEPKLSFGANELLKCPMCSGAMRLIRRSPHNEHGDHYERQMFDCGTCQHAVERSVDFSGNPHR